MKIEVDAGANPREMYIELLKAALSASLYDESAWYVFQEGDGFKHLSKRILHRLRSHLRDAVIRLLRKRSVVLVKTQPLANALRQEGRDWPFLGYTMIGHRRLDNVRDCIAKVLQDDIPGDLIETGVWRGGTTIFMRGVLKAYGVNDRRVWVADSFEGLPAPISSLDGTDLSGVEYLKVSLAQVRSNFERFGLLDDQVRFLEGEFRNTLPHAPIERLSILRLDGDLYSSTMDALRSLYARVSRGGYIIVDDYYSWAPCRKAVDEFLSEQSRKPYVERIDWAGAYWRVP
jgi:O-methyltransferase